MIDIPETTQLYIVICNEILLKMLESSGRNYSAISHKYCVGQFSYASISGSFTVKSYLHACWKHLKMLGILHSCIFCKSRKVQSIIRPKCNRATVFVGCDISEIVQTKHRHCISFAIELRERKVSILCKYLNIDNAYLHYCAVRLTLFSRTHILIISLEIKSRSMTIPAQKLTGDL